MGLFDFLGNKNKILGIDIGTAGIKVVEAERHENKTELVNYGLTQADLRTGLKVSDLGPAEIGGLIKRVLVEMKCKTRRAVISLPLNLSFSVLIEMPFLGQKELEAAIPYEAKKYIPVPIEDVSLDWVIIDQSANTPTDPMIKNQPPKPPQRIFVLLVAVPNEVIKKYTQVAKSAGLQLLSLEIESFAMLRSLVGNDPHTYLLLDFGTKGTNVVIAQGGLVRVAYNVESTERGTVLTEVQRIVNLHKTKYNKNIQRCILSGGSIYAKTGERENKEKEYAGAIKTALGLEANFGDPLARIEYPEKLKKVFADIGPALAVAVGLAMKDT